MRGYSSESYRAALLRGPLMAGSMDTTSDSLGIRKRFRWFSVARIRNS
jgi:hypothetical protein